MTRRARRLALVALLGLGWSYQQGLALVEHRGFAVMRDRAITTGHAEFVTTAGRDIDVWRMVVDYEHFVQAPDQEYARSKPPGQLLFYCAAAVVADRLMPLIWDPPMPRDGRIKSLRQFRLINFAVLFFPLIGLLVLFPLTELAVLFLGEQGALWPAFLYLLAPAPALVQLHLDQVLYPLLATSFWLCLAGGATAGPHARTPWLAAGAIAWLALFVSFSLLPMFVVGAGIALELARRRHGGAGFRALVSGALLAALAAAVLGVLANVVLGYEIGTAYARCMQHHVLWKRWLPEYRWPAARLNLVEFGYWLGPALCALFLARAVRGAGRSSQPAASVVAVATVIGLGLVAIFGRTLGEVARLWLFFVPAVALAAAGELGDMRVSTARARLTATAILQLAWTFSLKAMQDFH